MDLKVGQKLWFLSYHHSCKPWEIEIDKVGRKWAYATSDRLKIDKQTLVADGGRYRSPGRAYLSQEAYENEQVLKSKWDELRGRIPFRVPGGITLEKIGQIKKIIWGDDENQNR